MVPESAATTQLPTAWPLNTSPSHKKERCGIQFFYAWNIRRKYSEVSVITAKNGLLIWYYILLKAYKKKTGHIRYPSSCGGTQKKKKKKAYRTVSFTGSPRGFPKRMAGMLPVLKRPASFVRISERRLLQKEQRNTLPASLGVG